MGDDNPQPEADAMGLEFLGQPLESSETGMDTREDQPGNQNVLTAPSNTNTSATMQQQRDANVESFVLDSSLWPPQQNRPSGGSNVIDDTVWGQFDPNQVAQPGPQQQQANPQQQTQVQPTPQHPMQQQIPQIQQQLPPTQQPHHHLLPIQQQGTPQGFLLPQPHGLTQEQHNIMQASMNQLQNSMYGTFPTNVDYTTGYAPLGPMGMNIGPPMQPQQPIDPTGLPNVVPGTSGGAMGTSAIGLVGGGIGTAMDTSGMSSLDPPNRAPGSQLKKTQPPQDSATEDKKDSGKKVMFKGFDQ